MNVKESPSKFATVRNEPEMEGLRQALQLMSVSSLTDLSRSDNVVSFHVYLRIQKSVATISTASPVCKTFFLPKVLVYSNTLF